MMTRGIRNNNPLTACSIAAAQSDSSLKAAQADRSPQRTSLTLASVGGPRGIRNNNPLNIRYNANNAWRGKLLSSMRTDQDFEEFVSMDYGFLAALNLIGNTYMHRYHLNTPSAIIARWAPASENNTDGYIKTVCSLTGIGGEEVISNHDTKLRELVWAMAQVECGAEVKQYREDLKKAWAVYEPKIAKKVGRRHK